MNLIQSMVNSTIKWVTGLICRVDSDQLERVPKRGPLILIANHINFLEVPLVYTHLLPRPLTGLAKAEAWNNPIVRPLFNLWDGIPLERGEADLTALRRAIDALEAGKILAIAPEGTRSEHGRLQRAHPGVVTVALHSSAPLLPLVFYGGERFKHNILRLRRTDFHIIVGRPFRLRTEDVKPTRAVRQKMVDEIMYQLAALLPPTYRGEYADLAQATETYLCFPPESGSNLPARTGNQP